MKFFTRKKARPVIDVACASDYARIPQGSFICQCGRKETIGCNGPAGLSWDVRAQLTGEQMDQLPLVRLRFMSSQRGVARVGTSLLIDTWGDDGEAVTWGDGN